MNKYLEIDDSDYLIKLKERRVKKALEYFLRYYGYVLCEEDVEYSLKEFRWSLFKESLANIGICGDLVKVSVEKENLERIVKLFEIFSKTNKIKVIVKIGINCYY